MYFYRCNLTIQNPNGLNDFSDISGLHLPGMTDDHVQTVLAAPGSYSINIPSIICEKFINLRRIEFTDVGIENKIKIDENAFSGNLELGSFIFDRNQLSELPENVFKNQQKLISLLISSNNFEDFPKQIFNPLKNLNYLSLSGNKIKALRNEWFEKIENLQNLIMSTNQIDELPKDVFKSLTKLQYMDFARNSLKIIKSESFGLSPNLTDISFDNNQINAIDEEFVNKIPVKQLNVMLNVCVNDFINDDTESRENMRIRLKKCFENYEILIFETTTELSTTTAQTLPPGCIPDNLDERVCKLEESNKELEEKMENFHKEQLDMQDYFDNRIEILSIENKNQSSIISEIISENKQLELKTDEMQENIDGLIKQNELISDELEDQKLIVADIKEENLKLRTITENLQEKMEKQAELFATALEELEKKYLILSTRPCSC